MNHFSRPKTSILVTSGVLLLSLARAEGADLRLVLGPPQMLLSNSAQGYLGVGMQDLSSDRAAALKLKEARGAEITTLDQDAPASIAGIHLHDVIVQMNGQRVDGAEQLRRMLHETPPGRTVSLVALREGQTLSFSVQLVDRSELVRKAMGELDSDPASAGTSTSGAVVLPGDAGHGGGGHSGGFFGTLTRNRYYTGVDIQPLPTGLADYFGAKSGILVGNVFSNSPASAAGLKPADVIQKVNSQPVVTLSDWEKAIRVNRGKQVQVTVIRDRKEITLTMIAGEAKKSSEVKAPGPASSGTPMVAELKPQQID